MSRGIFSFFNVARFLVLWLFSFFDVAHRLDRPRPLERDAAIALLLCFLWLFKRIAMTQGLMRRASVRRPIDPAGAIWRVGDNTKKPEQQRVFFYQIISALSSFNASAYRPKETLSTNKSAKRN